MHCESIFVETVIDNKAIIVGVNYRKPNTPHLEFLHSLESCLDQLSASGKSCIILGDVNIDTSTDSAPAIQYNTLLNSYNFYQIINTATRITDNTSTIIDHCLTNITNYFINCGTLQSDITDHYPIFCIINHLKHILKPANSAQILNFKNYNPDAFLSDLNATSWQPVYDCTDPNIAYEAFYNIFYNIVSNHVHTKTARHSNSIRKPWLSNGILKSVRTKHRLFTKMKNNPHNVNYKLKYKKYRNILTKLLKSVKKRYYFNKFRWAQGNINKTWQVINEVLNKSTNKLYPRKLISTTPNNDPLTESSDIANEFNDFFTSIGPSLASNITSATKFTQYLDGNYLNSFFFHPVSEQDVLNEIKTLDPRKAVGYDNIHPRLVTHAAHIIARPLAHIINCSLSQGIVPNSLKIAKIMPIYKKGAADNVSNYRPISILPTFSKIIESLVNKQFINYLETKHILLDTQFGFRKKYNTKLALADLVSDISEQLDNGFITFGIFIDLKKAFDTINHDILIHKLEHYGIRGIPLHWFKNYLTNRQQYVTIDNVSSPYKHIQCGVPQGSILGPILFLIYINDIANSTNSFQFRLFADDTNLFKSIEGNEINLTHINVDFQKVCDWCGANKLTVNVEKTTYMVIKTPRKPVNIEGSFGIDGNELNNVSSTTYLGVSLDINFNWKSHIQKVVKSIAPKIGLISLLRHFIPKSILLLLYPAIRFLYDVSGFQSTYIHRGWGDACAYQRGLFIWMRQMVQRRLQMPPIYK
ncbi:uncharacterized protein LOC144448040 [Glandiceps talaboti]